MKRKIFLLLLLAAGFTKYDPVDAQPVLFDFDTAPLSSPFPISLTVGSMTADFAATGAGYSIQNANVMGFTPAGFSGQCIYPSSVFASDLLVKFHSAITYFSILYACDELGCDDAATVSVTAYLNGNLEGSATMTAAVPGTWPSDTLSISIAMGFDSVVVHYASPPPTCQDYGVIFMADNMVVTPLTTSGLPPVPSFSAMGFRPNPVKGQATFDVNISLPGHYKLVLYDMSGRMTGLLFEGSLPTGEQHIVIYESERINAGTYIAEFSNEKGERSSLRVVWLK